ncbi:hypothetical protein [Nocardioides massiliensis]|uniref:Sec-independent protein translocase protein TatA n=1 Tax=Nocardioides massiliensis TaxID=1325935 RepID=A0ABT9NMF6_9ACTN|nr:hypothetical protein [Nocardioides massiliensis]MDP9821384.1 Sec-independent protein translocase protein TatA [Nocardioides massiliensis]
MGGNLVVNGVELEESYGKLTWLKSEFDSIESRNSDTRGIWGNDKLRDAMHEFATNMKHHRKELSQKIEDTRKKIETSQEAFEEADTKLRSELEKNTSDNPDHGSDS